MIRGQDHGRNYIVRGDSTSIGRDSHNQIRLNDTEVSRQHAKVIRMAEGEFELHDSGSSNGTYVNSQQVQRVVLQSGDRVQLGRTLMIFTVGSELHSGRSAEQTEPKIQQVEIVASESGDLSQIRSRVDSRPSHYQSRPRPPASFPTTEKGHSSTDSFVLNSPLADFADDEIVYQVSQAIRHTIDIPELLNKVLVLIFQWIQCDRGCILIQDEVSGGLRPATTRHRKLRSPSSNRPLQISRSILEHVMHSNEGILTSNAQEDDRWDSAASITGLGICEVICVPMQGRYGMQGVIYVDTEMSAGQYAQLGGKCSFDHRHLKLMIAIGGQAALAIEDTQFYSAMLQSERLATMGQTIADLSHHVKNILQGISGGSFLVEDGLARQDVSIVQRGWSIVKKNQDRISGLVMDMLSFSKEREPDLQPADINRLVNEVIELVQVRASESDVRLSVSTNPSQELVLMDSHGIQHALLNVVNNAVDAAAACDRVRSGGGQVHVTCELSPDHQNVIISVEDNGDGIPPDQIARVFAPFHSSKGSRGTGLGLPVSQKILREHGGDLLVNSTVDSGSKFTLQWPVETSPSFKTSQMAH